MNIYTLQILLLLVVITIMLSNIIILIVNVEQLHNFVPPCRFKIINLSQLLRHQIIKYILIMLGFEKCINKIMKAYL